MNLKSKIKSMKDVAPKMAAAGLKLRNGALLNAAKAIEGHAAEIFEANKKDLAAADEKGLSAAIIKRLKFDEAKLKDSVEGLRQLAGLSDPLRKVTLARELDEGLTLYRTTCPIGVIGVIFEARPDALIQISALCIKSGNCAILKGGKETANTNRVLFEIIHEAAALAGLPSESLLLAETHDDIDELLGCDEYVDLIIPRGSNAFVRHIMDNTKIPVMGHSDGICHVYVDAAANQDMAIRVIIDAKTQYAAACNAAETILVHKDIAEEFLPKLTEALDKAGVKIRLAADSVRYLFAPLEDANCLSGSADSSDRRCASMINEWDAPHDMTGELASSPDKEARGACGTRLATTEPAGEMGTGAAGGGVFSKETDYFSVSSHPDIEIITDNSFPEYLDFVISIKVVADIDAAISHINKFGSHHTDAIITDDPAAADKFMQLVDSAGVYQNCSTRFADGFRYGFGAEVGISTGKIHARGPVGLEGLTTYKYKLVGDGHIVGDYAEGLKTFNFRDL